VPKATIGVGFPVAGVYEAFCGIHPCMRPSIEVQ
jgi:hypothetical protein